MAQAAELQLHLECIQRHGVSLCDCKCRISRLQRKFAVRSVPFSTTHNKQSLDGKTSLFLTVCRKAVSHIFADICIPRARLQKPLSKDGFPTLEYSPKPLAGHLYGRAKIVTGCRTPKSKPSLQNARTAAGNSSTA